MRGLHVLGEARPSLRHDVLSARPIGRSRLLLVEIEGPPTLDARTVVLLAQPLLLRFRRDSRGRTLDFRNESLTDQRSEALHRRRTIGRLRTVALRRDPQYPQPIDST